MIAVIAMKNEEIQYIIEAGFKGVRAELNAGTEIIKIMNDKIDKQDNRIDKVEDKVNKNTIWRKSITLAGTAVIALISFIFTKLAALIR